MAVVFADPGNVPVFIAFNGITDLGVVDFDDIDCAPDTGYVKEIITNDDSMVSNVFCLKTRENNYVKFRIVSQYFKVVIEWFALSTCN
jgi:hypothetical protein